MCGRNASSPLFFLLLFTKPSPLPLSVSSLFSLASCLLSPWRVVQAHTWTPIPLGSLRSYFRKFVATMECSSLPPRHFPPSNLSGYSTFPLPFPPFLTPITLDWFRGLDFSFPHTMTHIFQFCPFPYSAFSLTVPLADFGHLFCNLSNYLKSVIPSSVSYLSPPNPFFPIYADPDSLPCRPSLTLPLPSLKKSDFSVPVF